MSQPDIFIGDRATDWATPRAFLDWLDHERSWVPNLDAAADIRNTKAPHFFNESDDGLSKEWYGNVWLNPPYGRAIPEWLEKCNEQIKRKEVESIMVLVPARTDTKWFHELIMPHAYLVFLIKGRFNHERSNAVAGANAPFPSMLVWYRKHKFPDAGITTLEVPKEARGFNGS